MQIDLRAEFTPLQNLKKNSRTDISRPPAGPEKSTSSLGEIELGIILRIFFQKMKLKSHFKKYDSIVTVYLFFLSLKRLIKPFLIFMPIELIKNLVWYFKDYTKYKKNMDNPHFTLSFRYWFPCIVDRTSTTPVEPIYFYQDTWAASKIFQLKPQHHYDIGSSVKAMGIISQFVPTTMVDIRPLDVRLNNLFFIRGSILELPFENNSIESLSSLCVVEHIGLGRYGDPLDSWGSEKAIQELKRVLKPGGNLLFSVPVDDRNRIYFNAHRAFDREYIIKLFQNMVLIEEKYIYGTAIRTDFDRAKGFGTGLYHFMKENR